MALFDRFFGPPSKAAFAEAVISALRDAGDTRELTYDEDQFAIIDADGKMNLGNMYQEHCAVPRKERKRHLAGLVQAFLQSAFKVPADFEDVKPDLRPKIWSRWTFEELELQHRISGDSTPDIPLVPLGSHLCIGLVYDLPTSMRSVASEDLETWGTTLYEALEIARENLRETTVAFASIGESHHTSVTCDNYDSCRILLLDRLRQLKFTGDPVAMVANRDSLYLTGTEDEVGLKIMAELTEEALDDPRPLSAIPLRLDGDDWVDWMPNANHPSSPQFRLLELKTMFGMYETQKQLLEQIHKIEDVDIHVAGLSAVEEEDGNVFSYCVWSDGVDSLLPESQEVMFFQEGKDVVARADWDRVQEVVGDQMKPEGDLYPSRFRVRQFPTAPQLQELAKETF